MTRRILRFFGSVAIADIGTSTGSQILNAETQNDGDRYPNRDVGPKSAQTSSAAKTDTESRESGSNDLSDRPSDRSREKPMSEPGLGDETEFSREQRADGHGERENHKEQMARVNEVVQQVSESGGSKGRGNKSKERRKEKMREDLVARLKQSEKIKKNVSLLRRETDEDSQDKGARHGDPQKEDDHAQHIASLVEKGKPGPVAAVEPEKKIAETAKGEVAERAIVEVAEHAKVEDKAEKGETAPETVEVSNRDANSQPNSLIETASSSKTRMKRAKGAKAKKQPAKSLVHQLLQQSLLADEDPAPAPAPAAAVSHPPEDPSAAEGWRTIRDKNCY